ncbi:MAG: hypothetical protein AAFX93_19540 [Verrucomicrobiota bacterium]
MKHFIIKGFKGQSKTEIGQTLFECSKRSEANGFIAENDLSEFARIELGVFTRLKKWNGSHRQPEDSANEDEALLDDLEGDVDDSDFEAEAEAEVEAEVVATLAGELAKLDKVTKEDAARLSAQFGVSEPTVRRHFSKIKQG